MRGIPDVNRTLRSASEEALSRMVAAEDARTLHNILYMADGENRERVFRLLSAEEAEAIRAKLGGTTALDLNEIDRVLRDLTGGSG